MVPTETTLTAEENHRNGEVEHHLSFNELDQNLRKCLRSLYSKEAEQIRHAFWRMREHARDAKTEVILVEAKPGYGKTALAHSIKDVVENDGIFLQTKLDRFPQRRLYGAFEDCLHALATNAVFRGKTFEKAVADAIKEGVDIDGQTLLSRTIPSFATILGNQKSAGGETFEVSKRTRDHGPSASSNNFKFLFGQILRAVSSPSRPIVLVLDNLHYADDAALDIIEPLLSDTVHHNLFFIATTIQEDKVSDFGCSLSISLKDRVNSLTSSLLQSCRINMTLLSLKTICEAQVRDLLVDILGVNDSIEQTLLPYVWKQSNGSPFDCAQVVIALQAKEFLGQSADNAEWRWNGDRIHELSSCLRSNLLQEKLRLLPISTRKVLEMAACLGSKLDEDLLQRALSEPLGNALHDAMNLGLLDYDQVTNTYFFVHDVVHRAIYNLVPVDQRATRHYEAGIQLWKSFDSVHDLEDALFVVLGQLMIGSPISEAQERKAIAKLCLRASELSSGTPSFHTLFKISMYGIALLDERSWRDRYGLTLGLYNAAAEAAYGAGLHDEVFTAVDDIFKHTRTFDDALRAHCIKIYALGCTAQPNRALDYGLTILEKLGEGLPSNPGLLRTVWILRNTRARLRRVSDESILRLPLMRDVRKLAAMQIMNILVTYAFLDRLTLTPFFSCRMIQLTLDFGLSAVSCMAFSCYGSIVAVSGLDRQQGHRFGNLGYLITEKFRTKSFDARMAFAVYHGIFPWKYDVRDSLRPLLEASRMGFASGDTQFGHLCIVLRTFHQLERTSLILIQRELAESADNTEAIRQAMVFLLVRPFQLLVDGLVAPSFDRSTTFDMESAAKGSLLPGIDTGQLASELFYCFLNINHAALLYLSGDVSKAAECAREGRPFIQMPHGPPARAFCCMIDGLIATAVARRHRKRRAPIASKWLRLLTSWAQLSPRNFLGKQLLLEAELAALKAKSSLAYSKYVAAIGVSTASGYLMESAIASERIGEHLLQMGSVEMAKYYFSSSLALYNQWGARAKVKKLSDELSIRFTSLPLCARI